MTAFSKLEPTLSSITQLTRNTVVPYWQKIRAEETRLFHFFVVVSALCHVFFFVFDIGDFAARKPLIEEWTMDADLVADNDIGAPKLSSLPDAVKAPDPKVSERMLPQLPKKFAINEPPPPEENTLKEPDEAKKEQPKPEAKELPKEAVPEQPVPKQDPEEKNKIDLNELRKRAALEALRRDQKTDKQTVAPENQDAKLAEVGESKKDQNSGTTTGIPDRQSFRRYRGALQAAVRRNYLVPEAYHFKEANIAVVVAIKLSERGDLMDVRLEKSSGDDVFDDMAIKAMKASAPLPPPPKELAGETILLQFTP